MARPRTLASTSGGGGGGGAATMAYCAAVAGAGAGATTSAAATRMRERNWEGRWVGEIGGALALLVASAMVFYLEATE